MSVAQGFFTLLAVLAAVTRLRGSSGRASMMSKSKGLSWLLRLLSNVTEDHGGKHVNGGTAGARIDGRKNDTSWSRHMKLRHSLVPVIEDANEGGNSPLLSDRAVDPSTRDDSRRRGSAMSISLSKNKNKNKNSDAAPARVTGSGPDEAAQVSLAKGGGVGVNDSGGQSSRSLPQESLKHSKSGSEIGITSPKGMSSIRSFSSLRSMLSPPPRVDIPPSPDLSSSSMQSSRLSQAAAASRSSSLSSSPSRSPPHERCWADPTRCNVCEKKFKALRRFRHHCKFCLTSFCHKCGTTTHSFMTSCKVPGTCVCARCEKVMGHNRARAASAQKNANERGECE